MAVLTTASATSVPAFTAVVGRADISSTTRRSGTSAAASTTFTTNTWTFTTIATLPSTATAESTHVRLVRKNPQLANATLVLLLLKPNICKPLAPIRNNASQITMAAPQLLQPPGPATSMAIMQ